MLPQPEERLGPAEAGRDDTAFFLGPSESSWPSNPLTLDFWPPKLRKNTFLSRKPLSLWQFAKAILGNYYTAGKSLFPGSPGSP